MIQAHRKTHRLIILALAVLLPALYVAAMLVRKPFPTNQRLPAPAKGAVR